MKTENISIELIKPYKRNTKKHDQTQIDNVAKSIEKYGFVQPLVIDKDGVIVIGHCRFAAAKQLGMKDVPCVRVDDLTPDQVNALRILDNKTNESPWDFDLLAEEIEGLDLDDFELDFGIAAIGNSYIDDLMEDTLIDKNSNPDTFNVTLTFPKEKEDEILQYIKDYGKDSFVSLIIKEVERDA